MTGSVPTASSVPGGAAVPGSRPVSNPPRPRWVGAVPGVPARPAGCPLGICVPGERFVPSGSMNPIALTIGALRGWSGVREVIEEAVREDLDEVLDDYGYLPFGLPALRRAVARMLSVSGVPTRPTRSSSPVAASRPSTCWWISWRVQRAWWPSRTPPTSARSTRSVPWGRARCPSRSVRTASGSTP